MAPYNAENPLAVLENAAENQPGHKKFTAYNLPEWVRHPLKKQQAKVAILFPGEQNHATGMLRDAKKNAQVKQMLAVASKVLGYDVEELMADGPQDKMAQAAVNGPLMYVANCAAYEMLKIQHPSIAENAQGVAGYSVGEYTALYAAGVITFEQGLAIVKARAEAVQEAIEATDMTAMVFEGLELNRVEACCTRALKKAEAGAQASVVAQNGQSHSYVCGKKSTMEAVEANAKKEKDREGVKEISVMSCIPAGGSSLFAEANEKVAKAIDRTLPAMNPPRCELYLNATGWRVAPGTAPAKFVFALKEQLESPILWEGTIDQCMRWGIREFYECGPGKSLKNYMKTTEFLEEAPLVVLKPVESVTNITV